MELHEHLQRMNEDNPQLAQALAGVRTLEHVLDWMKARGLDLASLDMVTQDEYCHDLLLPLPAQNKWLVFAMT